MFLRDPLPPARVDVRVLFDRCLRERGIETDYVGHAGAAAVPGMPCRGRQFEVGAATDPRSWWRQARLLWRLSGHYDAIVVRDRPLVGALLFGLAALRRTTCLYWMSFPIPLGDRAGAEDHRRRGRPLHAALVGLRGRLGAWIENRRVLRQATHVFVQSDAMRQQLLRRHPALQAQVSAVPMGVDANLLRGVPSPDASGAPVVAYLGSLDRARRLDVVVDAIALLRQRVPEARLLLVGSSPHAADLHWLHAHAVSRGVGHAVEFAGAMPMDEAWALLARRAAVCVSAVPPGPLHDVSSPTKVIEYLALGLPVVANDIPDQRQLLEACGGGRCVAWSAQAFADGLSALLADPSKARAEALHARERALQLRSYDVLGRDVAAVLRRVVAVNRRQG